MKMFVEKGWFIITLQFGPDDVFVFEDWDETPAGPYRALFHYTPQDFRTLYVNSEEGRDLVSTIHRFDERIVTDIASRRQDGRWTIEVDTGDEGTLHMEVDYRETLLLKVVNPIVRLTPDMIARNPLYCKLVPRLAAPLMGTDPNQKMAGVTEMGRRSRFRIDRIFMVTGACCTWGGADLGPLTDCCYQHDMGDYRPVSKPVISYLSLIVED
jgi:hypothetical protein